MILVDSSAWIELDRATGSDVDKRLASLIATGAPIAVSDPIVMEVVAGANTLKRASELKRLLNSFSFLPFDSSTDFDAATSIHRQCRAAGLTPRGMLDCMIASVAWRNDTTLLTCDADLVRIAKLLEIDLDEATPDTN